MKNFYMIGNTHFDHVWLWKWDEAMASIRATFRSALDRMDEDGGEYDGYIEAEVQWAHEFDWYDKSITLEDADGNQYPCQIIMEKSVVPRFRSRFVFKAEIPAMGYKAFKVVCDGGDAEIIKNKDKDPYNIETKLFEIKISDKTGAISSIRNKKLVSA